MPGYYKISHSWEYRRRTHWNDVLLEAVVTSDTNLTAEETLTQWLHDKNREQLPSIIKISHAGTTAEYGYITLLTTMPCLYICTQAVKMLLIHSITAPMQ